MSGDKFYARHQGKLVGPFTMTQLKGLMDRQKFSRSTQISSDRKEWVRAADVPELFPPSQAPADETVPMGSGTGYDLQPAAESAVATASDSSADQLPWYYSVGGQQAATPVPTMVLLQMISSGQVKPDDMVWKTGMPQWIAAKTVPELQGACLSAMQQSQLHKTTVTGEKPNRRWVLVVTLLLVVGLAAVGGVAMMNNKSISFAGLFSKAEVKPIETSAINARGEIVNIVQGDADSAVGDSTGLVACYWRVIDRQGKERDIGRIPEERYDVFVKFRDSGSSEWKERMLYAADDVLDALQKEPMLFVRTADTPTAPLKPISDYKLRYIDAHGLAKDYMVRLANPTPGFYSLRELGFTGSCFFVTEDGYAITNRHVVQKAVEYRVATDALEKIRQRFEYQDLTPRVWVFVDSKLYPADVKYVSEEFDMAIIKIDRKQRARYRMAEFSDKLPRSEKVWSIGFPGAAQIPLTTRDYLLKQAQLEAAEHVADMFNEGDRKFSQNQGVVSRLFKSPQGWNMLQHDAVINPGNSGGPLIDTYGRVLGINTFKHGDAEGIYFAITMQQLREEIDKQIGESKVRWVTDFKDK